MTEKYFTHLHLHTEFSLLDGAIKLEKLIDHAKKNNFKALAITDHGNIFGAVKFFQLCKKAGIKPILGIETYFTEDVTQKSVDKKYYHLILLVQNATGYKNLCKLISFSYKEGFYFKPRIDYAMLEKYSEGLIATSACLGGHIPQLLINGNQQEANARIDWFVKHFGPDRFYLEIQPEDQPEQKILNEKLYAISKERGIPLVAAGDCHYLTPEDHEAHEVMLCIQTQNKITDPDRFSFGSCRVHMRNQTEMLELFKEHEDAIWNSGKIADMCTFDFETDKLFFPSFPIPNNSSPEEHFKHLCIVGLEKLIEQELVDMGALDLYWKRLHEEIDLITTMGFVGYFLVVSDFIQWSKANNIPVGPGRGSAAGSLVAWALQITNIDPLRYNLLFERFLNPERVSMPDIDIDFCIQGRDQVINYVRERYGHDKVGQIITFGTMMAKGVIKDVSRVLGIPFEDSNTISGMIPDQLKITLKEALEQNTEIKDLIAANPQIAKVFDLAFRLEGITRHASKHAAGIVISPEPIDEVLPIYVPPKSNEIVTQYAMSELEKLGFLKIDILGLKNLTLIKNALNLIFKNHGVTLNMDKLPLDDEKTFALICKGKTSGVFQLESDGLKDVLIKLQPKKFEDIIAINALYRPGPLGSGMVDDFVERRHGRQKVTYLFDELKDVLEETYGVIVYQEQVMKIASIIAGYSLGQSDILRRAMGKKKADVMAEQRQLFMHNAIERGFNEKKAGELFDLMAYFAGYGFNKSHSAAYALIAYHTAYLKANYTAEFMACLISLEADNAEKMAFYLQEAKELGLEIVPPDINKSEVDFTVVNGKIIFGLRGIKNVGMAALENMLAQRTKEPFKDLLDFCTKIDLRTANKRVLENLICAGALDSFPGNRAQKYEELHKVMDRAHAIKRTQETGQMDLFSTIAENNNQGSEVYSFELKQEWDNKTKLEKELEVIGFYLSAHPLDSYKKYAAMLNIQSFAHIFEKNKNNVQESEPLVIGLGLLTSSKVIFTKKNEKMAFITLEDTCSKTEVIIFPRLFATVGQWLDKYSVFIVKGFLDQTSQQHCKIKADQFVPADLFFQEWKKFHAIQLHIPEYMNQELATKMHALLPQGTVPLELIFTENSKQMRLTSTRAVAFNEEVLTQTELMDVHIKMVI